ncbi:MAG TPA: glutamine synthetase type III, partial [Methylophaga sp.]|nr:glutamine synthetase type III [Methylophaga sp.]
LMTLHGNVVFGGDGYSSEWHRMAVEERGLKNLPTTADALPYLRDESIRELFASTGVLSRVELESRYEVYAEQYVLSIEVEAKLVIEMAKTLIYPSASHYLAEISMSNASMADLGIEMDDTITKSIAAETNAMLKTVVQLEAAINKHDFDSIEAHMNFCANDIRALMDKVRVHVDALEGEVADDLWPLPKYREMLFIK